MPLASFVGQLMCVAMCGGCFCFKSVYTVWLRWFYFALEYVCVVGFENVVEAVDVWFSCGVLKFLFSPGWCLFFRGFCAWLLHWWIWRLWWNLAVLMSIPCPWLFEDVHEAFVSLVCHVFFPFLGSLVWRRRRFFWIRGGNIVFSQCGVLYHPVGLSGSVFSLSLVVLLAVCVLL